MDQNKLPSLEEGELLVEQQLQPELELHLIGIKNSYFVLSKAIEAVPPMKLDQVSSSMKVVTALLVKIANDLRSIAILSSKGYSVQAATIAASLYESAYMIAYIGDDEEIANRWIDHDDPTQMFIKTYPMTLNALKKLGVPNPEEEAKKEYAVYRQLCMVKHSNPLFQKSHSFIIEENAIIASPGPMTSDEFIRVSWFSIENAVKLAGLALQSFINNQLKSHANSDIINAYNDLSDLYRELNARGSRRYKGNNPFPDKL